MLVSWKGTTLCHGKGGVLGHGKRDLCVRGKEAGVASGEIGYAM